MPKARKPPQTKSQQLLVEGKNDCHVIWALCDRHQIPETFSVEVPNAEDGQGIEVLLAELPIRLKQENLHTFANKIVNQFLQKFQTTKNDKQTRQYLLVLGNANSV